VKPYYEDAACTIYHGDCREVLPLLSSVDLVLTDPPYAHAHVDGGGFAAARKFYAGGSLNGLSDFVLAEYEDVMMSAAPMLIAFHSRDLVPDYAEMARRRGRKYDLHLWHKTNAIPFTANTWKSDVEYIALVWQAKPGWVQLDQSMHSKVYTSALNIDPSHPTAKPLAILRKYLLVLNPRTVMDPFMGSGTTLRVAKDLGRKAIGIELEEKYCEIAAKRLAQGALDLFGEATA
jgi:site-specific DNA-methyltransferase (adenine-specific)